MLQNSSQASLYFDRHSGGYCCATPNKSYAVHVACAKCNPKIVWFSKLIQDRCYIWFRGSIAKRVHAALISLEIVCRMYPPADSAVKQSLSQVYMPFIACHPLERGSKQQLMIPPISVQRRRADWSLMVSLRSLQFAMPSHVTMAAKLCRKTSPEVSLSPTAQ